MPSIIQTNHLIIGSGIAGLTLAIKLAEAFSEKQITIITKDHPDESNTKYAQGGIAVVLNYGYDSFENHIQDTLKAGDGLCNKKVVEQVIKEGPKCFKSLLKWGSQFDTNTNGQFNLGKEGGHSHNRVAHHKDITGHEIEQTLLNKINSLSNIHILDHRFAVDIVLENDICTGILALNCRTKRIENIFAETTILATGGIGQVYGHTTNPSVATGDGIAMASRAHAKISNMEFIQFHPTTLFTNKKESSFLISEAVRGFGAHLKQKSGERFMFRFDVRGELASRDIVSQGINTILTETGDQCVYLDCTHLNLEGFKSHFPNIYKHCLSLNIDIAKDWIPVIPSSHYLCGGIEVNIHGQTSISNLFACGECSNTGLHGANRLASNSLLEALVYAHHIYDFHISNDPIPYQLPLQITQTSFNHTISDEEINTMKKLLQQLMRSHAGIIRRHSDLSLAKMQLQNLQSTVYTLCKSSMPNVNLYELKNMIDVSLLIVHQSIDRNENKGGFYNEDIES